MRELGYQEYCFRLHKERVYYLSQALARRAAHAERGKLVHLGTCFGKFTKSLKFRLHVTCLDYLAQFAKYKVWVKPSSELSYLYGNNVLKAGLGRITENTPQYQVRHPASSRAARPRPGAVRPPVACPLRLRHATARGVRGLPAPVKGRLVRRG